MLSGTRNLMDGLQQQLSIKSVQIRHVLLPRKYVPNSTGWPVILIDLTTDQGFIGRSYLQPYVKSAYAYVAAILNDLVERFRGKPISPQDLFREARLALHPIGLEGLTMAAVSGLDMAFWDALAQSVGLPLARLLGGSVGTVPAYSSNGLYLKDPFHLEREADELQAEGGFTGLKLRLGRAKLKDDLAAIEAVRKSCGDDFLFMADFSQIYSMAEALERCRVFDDLGLYWLEEPIVYDNFTGLADLRRRLKTPIQIGENFWGPRGLHQAIIAEATDFIMPDLMRIGGVTGWLRAAGLAAGAGIPVSTHLYPEYSAHLMRVTESAHWLEWANFANPVIAEPFVVKNAEIIIPDRPGSGVLWNEPAVEKYLVR